MQSAAAACCRSQLDVLTLVAACDTFIIVYVIGNSGCWRVGTVLCPPFFYGGQFPSMLGQGLVFCCVLVFHNIVSLLNLLKRVIFIRHCLTVDRIIQPSVFHAFKCFLFRLL